MKHDVASFQIDPARARIYYEMNEDGYARLTVLDARTWKPIALPRLPVADNVALAYVSRNGRFAELDIDGATLGFAIRAQLFVDAGFTFVQPNVRGSTGYGKAWLHADDAGKRLEGHGSVKRGNIVLTLGHTLAFFEQHLMGKPPAK